MKPLVKICGINDLNVLNALVAMSGIDFLGFIFYENSPRNVPDDLINVINKFDFKKKASCFRCFMPEQPIEENNCETEGIFSPVAGILGSLQANEVIKTILGLKDDLNNNVLIFNSLNMTLRKVKITKNPRCLKKCPY